jgi:flagellar hook-associated protein 3 FlgL
MITWGRVTERSIADRTMVNLQSNLSRLGDLQAQLSSGKQISKPSDSPSGTVAAMSYRGELRQLTQFSRNADDGKAWLTTIDSTLTGALDLVHQVQSLGVQGLNTGTRGDADRAALADQVDRLRESLLTAANTTYQGRPVFGGTTNGSVAYDAAGTYVGDSGLVQRSVASGVKVQVDASGPATFGTGATQLFTLLSNIATSLRSGSSALGGQLDELVTTTNGMQAQLSDVGARYNQLATLEQAGTDRSGVLQQQLSDVEDIDLPKTIMDLQLQQTAYQAALGAAARVIQPSLQQFLRT